MYSKNDQWINGHRNYPASERKTYNVQKQQSIFWLRILSHSPPPAGSPIGFLPRFFARKICCESLAVKHGLLCILDKMKSEDDRKISKNFTTRWSVGSLPSYYFWTFAENRLILSNFDEFLKFRIIQKISSKWLFVVDSKPM